MQIELIGCTSAGKSTLASHIVASCRDRGIDVVKSDDFVLGRVRLDWIKRRLARTIVMDIIGLPAGLIAWWTRPGLFRFMWQILAGLRRTSGFERLNVARNVLKKMGIHEIIRRHAGGERVVLVDEGSLQAAHNLFVHLSVGVNPGDVARFAGLVPLPDIAIYVKEDEHVLIERTMARGHKRIPGRSKAQVEVFVKRALQTFEVLARQPALVDRLLVVSPEQDVRARPEQGGHPALPRALEILRVGVRTLRAERSASLSRSGAARRPLEGVAASTGGTA